MLNEGNSASIFVYTILAEGSTFTGIVALNDFSDFDNILGHELTLHKKEKQLHDILIKNGGNGKAGFTWL